MATLQPFRTAKKKILRMFIEPSFLDYPTISTTSAVQAQFHANDASPEDIGALCKQGRLKEALHILKILENPIESCIYVDLLQGCTKKNALSEGKQIHAQITMRGFMEDRLVGNTLLNFYAKCRYPVDGRKVFDQMPQRDVCSWTVMIAAYAKNGHCEEALRLFYQMREMAIQPNQFTFASILPACAHLASLEQGKEIHEEVKRKGFQSNICVANALVDMYAKCGSIEDARDVFDKMSERDVISWTSLIAAFVQNGRGGEALDLYGTMHLTGMKPDEKTFSIVLAACADLADLEQGKAIHNEIIRFGFQFDVIVANALLDMYVKCGNLDHARELFNKMHQLDIVSWTVMIAGYAQNGQGEEALNLFQQMKFAGVKADQKLFAAVLPACANLVHLEQSIEIYDEIIRRGFQSDVFVASGLVNMHAKCGNIDKARELFDNMRQRDLVSWASMIAGYATHGYGKEALKLFEEMKHSGVNPDHVTFVSVLSACCHAGLVDEGYRLFNSMSESYGITPTIEHYSCMVDLLGRAGFLDEAKDFINKMPIKPDASVWSCLLGACRTHKNIGLAETVAECLFELEPKNAAHYVLLSNIYAAAGMWDDIAKIRKMMKDRGVKKTPAFSWIEVDKKVHAFLG